MLPSSSHTPSPLFVFQNVPRQLQAIVSFSFPFPLMMLQPKIVCCMRAILLTILFQVVSSHLYPHFTPAETLLSYGSASTHHTYLLSLTPNETIHSIHVISHTTHILPVANVNSRLLGQNTHNLTIHFNFDQTVGRARSTLVVRTMLDGRMNEYRRMITHHVYGIVFKDADEIVSGDERIGIRLPMHANSAAQTKLLRFVRYAPPTEVELSRRITVSVRPLHSPYQSDIVEAKIKFDNSASDRSQGFEEGTLSLLYNTMHSNYMGVVEIEDRSMQLHSESFETAIFASAEASSI